MKSYTGSLVFCAFIFIFIHGMLGNWFINYPMFNEGFSYFLLYVAFHSYVAGMIDWYFNDEKKREGKQC